jgi:hypothetical protein
MYRPDKLKERQTGRNINEEKERKINAEKKRDRQFGKLIKGETFRQIEIQINGETQRQLVRQIHAYRLRNILFERNKDRKRDS